MAVARMERSAIRGFFRRRSRIALRSIRATRRLRSVPRYGDFGRTMAQPIRNSGCRPVTNHSKARGTSGTRPGKRCAISGGGVPAVSEARQTTTPPVWLNFARFSHGVRCGAASRKRCGRPASSADQGGKLRIARDRPQRLVGAALEIVAEEIRDRPCRQRRRHLAAAGPGHKDRGREHRERGRNERPQPRPSAICADGADGRDRRWRRSRQRPTSKAQCPRRPRPSRDRTGRRSRCPPAPGRARRNRRIARRGSTGGRIDDQGFLGVAAEAAGIEADQQQDAGHRRQQAAQQRDPVQRACAQISNRGPMRQPKLSARISQIR